MQSVSAIELKSAKTWFLISLFSALFAFIYEMFSFGVYSVFMFTLPLIPFRLGVLPCMILRQDMGRIYNDGVLMMMSGFTLCGILEIYGTASIWPALIITAGGILLLAGAAKNCAHA